MTLLNTLFILYPLQVSAKDFNFGGRETSPKEVIGLIAVFAVVFFAAFYY